MSEEDDDDLDLLIHFDSLKTQYANEAEDKGEVVDDESEEELHEWEGFEREDLIDALRFREVHIYTKGISDTIYMSSLPDLLR